MTWGFGIFILGWIVQSVVAFGFPYSPGGRECAESCGVAATGKQCFH